LVRNDGCSTAGERGNCSFSKFFSFARSLLFLFLAAAHARRRTTPSVKLFTLMCCTRCVCQSVACFALSGSDSRGLWVCPLCLFLSPRPSSLSAALMETHCTTVYHACELNRLVCGRLAAEPSLFGYAVGADLLAQSPHPTQNVRSLVRDAVTT
jgi:hypothetical protein